MSSPRRGYRSALRQEQAAATRERICEVAARLFESHGYGPTSMAQIARAAGVSGQTVYDSFGTKQRLAKAVMDRATSGTDVPMLLAEITTVCEPRAVVALAAQVTRRILERGTRAVEAMRRSDDKEILLEWRSWERRRYRGQQIVIDALSRLKVLRQDRTPAEELDILWALTGRDLYEMLVVERSWMPDRYEAWLTDALARELLEANEGGR